MAVFDTHKAVKTLTGVGFSETQAEALIDVVGEGYAALATKADITALREVMATKADLSDLELRMTAVFERQLRQTVFQLGALAVAVGGLVVAALKLFP
jgi:hypothetical protein